MRTVHKTVAIRRQIGEFVFELSLQVPKETGFGGYPVCQVE
jgi:hypothetical protein